VPEPDAETGRLHGSLEPLGAELQDSGGRHHPPRRPGGGGMRYADIDADRLWSRQRELDRIGATAAGGVHRMALTPEDIESHRLLAGWAAARGFSVDLDEIGNMFVTRAGADPSLPEVAAGSHLDSQPMAGRFDGPQGVLAAFEALEAIDDAGIATRHPLCVPVWNNEEGPRFSPACMGSAVYAGVRRLDE